MSKTDEGSHSALWDKESTNVFCDICIKEIEGGNRPTTHFSKDGWLNIGKRFNELTGREYKRLQFKNKWDQLKREWKIWKELKRGCTGLGWDPIKRTIDAPNEWWAEKLEMDPLQERRRRMAWAAAIAILLLDYYRSRSVRIPRMTSSFSGDKWIGEMISGHPIRFSNIFRMSIPIFLDLLNELSLNHGLQGSSRTTNREVLAITLFILSQNQSIRGATERFQHSSETISRYFSKGIKALVSLASQIIKPEDPSFASTPVEIFNDSRYMPYFKNCIGAIDGTHVDARPPISDKVAYIGRSGLTTQNVMAVCDFNMCFTFVMAGWEGSAHDSRIFSYATRNRSQCFPHPPSGKYYFVDAGYPMQRGYMKPYPNTRYHIPDFERASGMIRGKKEMFNKRHSSLRGVIERTFGVWKKKWVILRDMPSYSFQKQVYIVVATMTLHNFIRRHPSRVDTDFTLAESDEGHLFRTYRST